MILQLRLTMLAGWMPRHQQHVRRRERLCGLRRYYDRAAA